MAKISKYPAAATPQAADVVPIVQSGATKKATMAQLKTYMETGEVSVPTPTAENDFMTGAGSPIAWAKKTLAEVKTILGIVAAPTPTAENDVQVATGSPLGWAKKTLAEFKAILGLGGTVPAPTAANDFMVAAGSPLEWTKKTAAETKAALGVEKRTMLAMLLDKDVALAVGTSLGNVQIPIPAEWDGLTLTDAVLILSPLGTAQADGALTFQLVRTRPTSSPAAVDMLAASPAWTIAEDEKTSGTPTIDTANDDLAEGDFLSVDCESIGSPASAKGPLWLKITAE